MALMCCLSVLPKNVSAEEFFETIYTEAETVYANADAVDNGELFAGYVDELFGIADEGDASAEGIKNTGSRFDEGTAPRVVYDAVHNAAVQIAAGERESTVISLTGDDIGCGAANAYSALDLGVSAIVENNAITQESSDALAEKVLKKDSDA